MKTNIKWLGIAVVFLVLQLFSCNKEDATKNFAYKGNWKLVKLQSKTLGALNLNEHTVNSGELKFGGKKRHAKRGKYNIDISFDYFNGQTMLTENIKHEMDFVWHVITYNLGQESQESEVVLNLDSFEELVFGIGRVGRGSAGVRQISKDSLVLQIDAAPKYNYQAFILTFSR
jgi:hypothetical protein